MKRLVVATALLTLLLSPAVNAQSTAQTYGLPMTIQETTPLKEILDHPELFIGKEVRTFGYVYEMCTEMGCWLGLIPDLASSRMVKIAWYETEVRFPIGDETVGHVVELQGKVVSAAQESDAHAAHEVDEGRAEEAAQERTEPAAKRTIFVCPMHPDVLQEAEGTCPLCKMKLVAREVAVPTYGAIAIQGVAAVVRVKR